MGTQLVARIIGIAILIILLRPVAVLADSEQCEGTADCGRKGDVAYQRHDYQSAIAFYQQQTQHSEEDRENCLSKSAEDPGKACDSTATIAYNNLALANLHAGHAAKAQMWLSVAPPGARTEFNKRLVANALATRHWPSQFEGETGVRVPFFLCAGVVTRGKSTLPPVLDPCFGWQMAHGHNTKRARCRNAAYPDSFDAAAAAAYKGADRKLIAQRSEDWANAAHQVAILKAELNAPDPSDPYRDEKATLPTGP